MEGIKIQKNEIPILAALLGCETQIKINPLANVNWLQKQIRKWLHIYITDTKLIAITGMAGLVNKKVYERYCFNLTDKELMYIEKSGFNDRHKNYIAAQVMFQRERMPEIKQHIDRILVNEYWIKEYSVDEDQIHIIRHNGLHPEHGDIRSFATRLMNETGLCGGAIVSDSNSGEFVSGLAQTGV